MKKMDHIFLSKQGFWGGFCAPLSCVLPYTEVMCLHHRAVVCFWFTHVTAVMDAYLAAPN